MAYAALVTLAQLLEQIIHRHQFFYIPLSDEEQTLKSLHEKISFLQGFLDNYSHKAGETVRSLEARIRDASYQAQDIIEFHISDRIFSSDCESSGVKRSYEGDLLKALEHMDSIVKEVTNIQISYRAEEIRISHPSALASSSQAINVRNKMVGFDEDLIEIKERLCGESSKLEIIPIVGMGGIGKTTLARNVFDDSLVAYHFHTRAWVTISQEYHLREILVGLLASLLATSKDLSKTTNEELMEFVYKSLKGRRYLITMDDMWSPEGWDVFRRIFPDDNNGSRIVITTRLTDVAEYATSSPIHQMHFLNEDQSWNLLREKVFAEQSCPKELEEIGWIIAKKSGGLPLAIAVVAGILIKMDRTQNHWKNIAENISLAMATTDERFSRILALSYDNLPSHLKACFLYMGCFPEDYEIPVSKLIMLWVAEGFLRPIVCKSLEEVAEEYLENLVKRNLVFVTKKGSNGKYRFCGIHDLLRDLCIREAQKEKFLDVYTSGIDVANQQYRLTIRSNTALWLEDICIQDTHTPPIRSVFHFGDRWGLFSFVLRLRLLRVLDTPNTNLNSFPREITDLFHLRYLAFTYFSGAQDLFILPPEISQLHNLETLIIYSSSTLYLTLEIWRTPQIRHVISEGNLWFRLAPRNYGHFPVLENLQTLSRVVDFEFTSRALDMIRNLKKLKIRYTGVSSSTWSKLCLNNLAHLHQLETLNLDLLGIGRMLDHPVPAIFALPPNLKKLTLKGFLPCSGHLSIIGSLPNLEVLKLSFLNFVEGKWQSNDGEFPKLKFLLIEMSNMECWRAESTHFPCLQHLVIRECWRLKEIPRAIGDITTLELIEVDRYSKSAADSAVLIQEEQRSLGNDILQVCLSS